MVGADSPPNFSTLHERGTSCEKLMAFKIHLLYFRPTGRFLGHTYADVDQTTMEDIWEEVHELRRIGRLPGLRPNAGRDLIILVDVPDHQDRKLQLILPPSLEEEDITPVHVPTGEMVPLARTSTSDLVADVTPVDPFTAEPDPDE